MKLQLASQPGLLVFTGYGAGYVAISQQRYERSLVLMPDRVIEDAWQPDGFNDLTARHFEFLATLATEIVLLGTGDTLRFPPPALTACLRTARIGLEIMDTRAACRTYNILVAESRSVAAAILLS